ncbi:hypothetical protein GCM10029978_045490 [Actinoallomurus acanthiterrae]
MTPPFASRVKRALSELDQADHNTGKGMRLQHVVELVLNSAPGIQVIDRNRLDVSQSAETDLWLTHERRINLPFTDPLVPVECKNENHNASSAQIREFSTKIRQSGGSDGLLVVRKGLSGEGIDRAHNAVQMALAEGVRILVLTCADLSNLSKPSDFAVLVKARYVELRIHRTYLSL